jgi:hypothetical protein
MSAYRGINDPSQTPLGIHSAHKIDLLTADMPANPGLTGGLPGGGERLSSRLAAWQIVIERVRLSQVLNVNVSN